MPSIRKTLAGVVGGAVAIALAVSIPADESSRKVEASVHPDTKALQVRHISGRQYLQAYFDIAGIATACDGLTRDELGRPIRIGMRFTEAQCGTMLERALVAHAEGAMACTPSLALSADSAVERHREGPRLAIVSLAYNIGVGRVGTPSRRGVGYCGSTARRLFEAGNFPAACDAILRHNKYRHRRTRLLTVAPGLDRRRQKERRVCLNGLAAL